MSKVDLSRDPVLLVWLVGQGSKWLKADETLKSIPVIAVTAFAMAGDEEKIREGGCDAYISKPISISNFLQTVESFAKPLVVEREAV